MRDTEEDAYADATPDFVGESDEWEVIRVSEQVGAQSAVLRGRGPRGGAKSVVKRLDD